MHSAPIYLNSFPPPNNHIQRHRCNQSPQPLQPIPLPQNDIAASFLKGFPQLYRAYTSSPPPTTSCSGSPVITTAMRPPHERLDSASFQLEPFRHSKPLHEYSRSPSPTQLPPASTLIHPEPIHAIPPIATSLLRSASADPPESNQSPPLHNNKPHHHHHHPHHPHQPHPSPSISDETVPTPSTTPNTGTGVHTCTNCFTTTASKWRRNAQGQRLCNACALYEAMYKRPRIAPHGGTEIVRRNRKGGSAAGASSTSSSSIRNRKRKPKRARYHSSEDDTCSE